MVIMMDVVCITLFTKKIPLSMFKPLKIQLQLFGDFFLLIHGSSNVANMHALWNLSFLKRLQTAWKCFAIARVYFLLTCLFSLLLSADIIKYLVSESAGGRGRDNDTECLSRWPKRLFLVRRIAFWNRFNLTKKQVVIFSSHLHNFVSLAFISAING